MNKLVITIISTLVLTLSGSLYAQQFQYRLGT